MAITFGGSRVLIDCGEGTLVALERAGVSIVKLDAVCITHMHGDHLYGLPGLLTTMALAGRQRSLTLLGPASLRDYVAAVLRFSHAHLTYPIDYLSASSVSPQRDVLHLRDLSISTLPMQHRIEAAGFSVSERDKGLSLKAGIVERLGVPYHLIPDIRAGADITLPTGQHLANRELTQVPSPRRSLLYLSDTAKLGDYPPDWLAPTLLIHDATFFPGEEALAQKTGHSTTAQAAAFAKTCGAERLLLTHVSARYDKTDEALAAVRHEFGQTDWAEAGTTVRF